MGVTLGLFRLPQHRLEAVCANCEEQYRYDQEIGALLDPKDLSLAIGTEHIGMLYLGKTWDALTVLLDPMRRSESVWWSEGLPSTPTGASVCGWHKAQERCVYENLRYNESSEVQEIRSAFELLDLEALIAQHKVALLAEGYHTYDEPSFWMMLMEKLSLVRDFYHIAADQEQAVLTELG